MRDSLKNMIFNPVESTVESVLKQNCVFVLKHFNQVFFFC